MRDVHRKPDESVSLLLVNPRGKETFWQFEWLTRLLGKRAMNPPLGLATVAAHTPVQWNVRIFDENISEGNLENVVDIIPDIVGVTGTNIEYRRQLEWLGVAKRLGKYTVAGGPFVTLCPELYEGAADTLIFGEAEKVWPEFCADWPNPKPVYRGEEVDMSETQIPRFDLLEDDMYLYHTVQTSRGCPYACEFCDAIVLYGRKPRVKSVEHVLEELDILRERGVQRVFFADDNFMGNRKYMRELVRALDDYQHEHDFPFRFGTEVSINVARDGIWSMAFAGFEWVFVGIETPDKKALKLAGKRQNTYDDLLQSVRDIHATGIHVYGGFIVGFDSDDESCFEVQREFIEESGIQVAMISPLLAFPGTPLHKRLADAGRIVNWYPGDNTTGVTNIKPAKMNRWELQQGHNRLYQALYEDAAIARRIDKKMEHLGTTRKPLPQPLAATRRLVRALPPIARRQIKAYTGRRRQDVIREWSMALMVQDYVKKHHGCDPR